MLKIRLSRTGKKRQPGFRVVVQEHTAPIKGKFVESLGDYQPATGEKRLTINGERVKYWLSVGARPSDTVAVLLKKEGFESMDQFIEPRNKQRKKKKSKSETAAGGGSEAPSVAKDEAKTSEAASAPEDVKEEMSRDSASVPEDSRAEEAPQETSKDEEVPQEEAKAEEPSAEEAKAEESPAEEAKAEEPPAEEAKAKEPPQEEAATEEQPKDESK